MRPEPVAPDDQTEIKAAVCLACSNWLHGNGKVYEHAFKPRNMTPEQRALGPLWFASAVVALYQEKLIFPAIDAEMNRRRADILSAAVSGKYNKETAH